MSEARRGRERDRGRDDVATSARPAAGTGGAAAVAAPASPFRFEPKVLGESKYDRVTSMLMAVVVGVGLVVGWLALVYATNQAFASRVPPQIEIIPVFGGGGGSPDGVVGSTEKIDVPGADYAASASNNQEIAGDFEPPQALQTPAAMLSAVADAGQGMAEVDIGAVMPNGGAVASGKRSSKFGTGGPGFGYGPGDGGVATEQRWSIVQDPGQTLDEYARQLDYFRIELAVVSGKNQLTFVSNFSDAAPTKRIGSGQGDDRLFFSWTGQGRKKSDVELLRRAGIEVGEGLVLQFFPKNVERTLEQLEVRFKGRQPAEIKVTRFGIVAGGGDGYTFKVLSQEPLR